MRIVHSKDSPTTTFAASTTLSILPSTPPSRSVRNLGIYAAQEVARRVVEELGIERPDQINIYEIVAKYRAAIFETSLDGASAQLVRRSDRPTITLSEAVTDPKKRMFDLGHELGHYVLGHRSSPAHELGHPGMIRYRAGEGERDPEAEASVFSSEVLTPFTMLERYAGAALNADLVRTIAATFPVSVLTAALRLIELTDTPCMAVFSEAGRVKWSKRSVTFPFQLARGKCVQPGSIAWDFFETGAIEERELVVSTATWFGAVDRDVTLIEHAIVSVEHRTVLSLLLLPEIAK